MLDVHPPEHAAHSWRDFFIHIATIVVGLLIAVALEQTVEALHHRHQRHELLEQLESEHEQVLKDAEGLAEREVAQLNWYAARIQSLQDLAAKRGRYKVPEQPGFAVTNIPHTPVWQAAKASGLTENLSQQDVIANSELATLVEHLDSTVDQLHVQQNTVVLQACGRLPQTQGGRELDYEHADARDLHDCLAAYMQYYATRRDLYSVAAYIVGAERSVLSGETNIDRINASEIATQQAMSALLTRPPLPQ